MVATCHGFSDLSKPQYFRPQTVFVSQLFLQLTGYVLGVVLREILPGPGNPHEKFRIGAENRFWRFINPGPFSASTLR